MVVGVEPFAHAGSDVDYEVAGAVGAAGEAGEEADEGAIGLEESVGDGGFGVEVEAPVGDAGFGA